MGLFGQFGTDINQGVADFRETQGAVLLDVRSSAEYAGGHIPGSVNIPLDGIQAVLTKYPDRQTPLFVYCLSGGRSGRAVRFLKDAGYTSVINIGGIGAYKGEVSR